MSDRVPYMPRFEAVPPPASTGEVQAVVKLCNKHRVQYKASSTGWLYCDPTGPNCIKLDLRRMNRIIEINEKSMYAVVEPYVIGAQLQAECMKRGLNCNLTGAGSTSPPLRRLSRRNTLPLGGLGVFTRAAQKLYHWPGPSTFPMEGVSPKYKPAFIPPGFLVRYFSFHTLDEMIDATLKIGEAEIATELMGFK